MKKQLNEVFIVSFGRSPIGKANKGSLSSMHPVDYAAQVVRTVINKIPQLDENDIDDVIIGCSKPEGVQSHNFSRNVAIRAGIPDSVPAMTITRFCSTGLQTIATGANAIAAGQADVIVAGGAESMTQLPMGSIKEARNKWLVENSDIYMSMGITAENVAQKYGITRNEMEDMAMKSHRKAANAQDSGRFAEEIVPIEITDLDGKKFYFSQDECIRRDTTLEKLAVLKPVFKENGIVTAGVSSQVCDGAGAVVLMSKEKAESINIKPLAKFVGFAVSGVSPAYMGIGPILAVPKVMKQTGLTIDDMDVIELNEAFAAQAIPCIRELKMDIKKVNPNGGAIALGHPTGATGAILVCKALSELIRKDKRYGLITMCIGGGMGAAAIIERIK